MFSVKDAAIDFSSFQRALRFSTNFVVSAFTAVMYLACGAWSLECLHSELLTRLTCDTFIMRCIMNGVNAGRKIMKAALHGGAHFCLSRRVSAAQSLFLSFLRCKIVVIVNYVFHYSNKDDWNRIWLVIRCSKQRPMWVLYLNV